MRDIMYRHKKTGIIVERWENSACFTNNEVGDNSLQINKSIVEESSDWERTYPKVDWYPAELVEPLFNCRLENVDTYVDHLINYRNKIQKS
jgi:hypothetical protein